MSDGSLFDLSAFGPEEPENEPSEEQVDTPQEDVAPNPAPSMPMPGFEDDPEPGEMLESSPDPEPTPVPATEKAPPADTSAPSDTVAEVAIAATSPTALYRKYRPQTFASDEHFGQEHVVNTLRNAIALDRIAHAYLFCGPRGTGKTSTARILAKAVNCEDPDPNNRPCNECPSCIAITSGSTTDVIEIDAASNRGIDDIRDLRERVKYAPTQLKTKFYIIDEAHQITGAAANAFLKTLEEPPAHTKFILATTDPEDLLQTIVSRCQRFDFRRISLDATVANLSKIAESENIDIDDDAKAMIARHATGSLRDAQGLLDQVAVYRDNADDAGTKVTIELVRTVLGVSRNDRVEDIATALADRDAGAGVRAIGEAVDAGDDVRQLARQLLIYMRELLLEKSGGTSDLDDAGKKLAQRFDLAELANLTRVFGDIDFKVKHASISQLPLEIAVIEGAIRGSLPSVQAQHAEAQPPQSQAQQAPAQSGQQTPPLKPAGSGNLISRVQGGARRNAGNSPAQPTAQPPRPAPTEQQEPQRTQPAPTSQPADSGSESDSGINAVRSKWGQIKADVHAVNVRIGALLSEMDPASLEGNRIILTVPYTFHAQKMNSEETRLVVEQVLTRVMGKPMSLECFTTDEFRTRVARKSTPPTASTPPAPTPTQASEPIDVQKSDVSLDNDGESEPPIDPTDTLRAVKNIFDADEIDSSES